jgi:hypothetical protein
MIPAEILGSRGNTIWIPVEIPVLIRTCGDIIPILKPNSSATEYRHPVSSKSLLTTANPRF